MKASVPLKKSDIRVTQLERGVVLYNPRTEEAHLLNPAALLVWECCNGEYTVDRISHLLRSVYRLEEDVSAEVHYVLKKFTDNGLLSLLSRH
jgi:hypothetical protein